MARRLTLQSFQVRLFRNIVDSGPVQVDEVTCLVGKNEAGKSALLQALHHLNPAKPEMTLDLLNEYPRWLKKEHEISGEIEDAVPITAAFVISDDLVADLAERFGDGVVAADTVRFYRTYAAPGELKVNIELDQAAFIDPLLEASPRRLKDAVGTVTNTSVLAKKLKDLVAGKEDGTDKAAALGGDAEDAQVRLHEALGGAANLTTAVCEALVEHLPKTFYFSSYSQLDGRYRLDEVFAAVAQGTEDESIEAAADFLQLARVVPENIEDWDFEASNSELEAISSLLTKRVKEHWKQNDHLRLRVSLETQQENLPTGQQHAVRYLQFRVEDTRHDFSSRLDRRSTGFRWFISFIASFLEFEKEDNLILLLDEPGLSLHARAQMDLLDTIESKVARGRQVLYSTHSPFMVKTSQLNRARITEDQGPDKGSVVINDAGVVTDPDTLFPLQAALGYDVVQSLFIGDQNVLVEGVSDFIYISMLSEHLLSRGRTGLTDSCRLLPAGGATNIPTFIALLGTRLDIVVVLDGNSDQQKIENSISRGRLDQAGVLVLDTFTSVPGADIEDLFEPDEYLTLFNGCFKKNLKLEDLKGKDRIVKRIARKEGADFNHGTVAAHFLRNLDSSLARLSDTTLARFESLIDSVNNALPR